MRIKEDDRNIMLLVTVTLFCGVVAGAAALFEAAPTQVRAAVQDNQVTAAKPADAPGLAPVRVVGAPFVPNVNPSER